jgi:hypothetical protein
MLFPLPEKNMNDARMEKKKKKKSIRRVKLSLETNNDSTNQKQFALLK